MNLVVRTARRRLTLLPLILLQPGRTSRAKLRSRRTVSSLLRRQVLCRFLAHSLRARSARAEQMAALVSSPSSRLEGSETACPSRRVVVPKLLHLPLLRLLRTTMAVVTRQRVRPPLLRRRRRVERRRLAKLQFVFFHLFDCENTRMLTLDHQ